MEDGEKKEFEEKKRREEEQKKKEEELKKKELAEKVGTPELQRVDLSQYEKAIMLVVDAKGGMAVITVKGDVKRYEAKGMFIEALDGYSEGKVIENTVRLVLTNMDEMINVKLLRKPPRGGAGIVIPPGGIKGPMKPAQELK